MDFLALHTQPFFQWLLQTSWQAGLLVCLILLLQKALGRRLGVRGRYWLWLVLVVRLVLFWVPPSPVSVFNLLPHPPWAGYAPVATGQPGKVGPVLAAPDAIHALGGPGQAGLTARGLGAWARRPVNARALLFALWLAGAGALTGYIIAGHLRLRCIVRREPAVTDRRILEVLEDCQRLMGVKRTVEVVATDGSDSPALLGFLRPRLLLSRGALAELSQQELRHIFLHELAHLRRDDIVVGYLAALLHVLHWFNPLVALAFQRMRADREMVCDALALSALAPGETAAYGRTIIHQIEQWQMFRPRWIVAALSSDRAPVRQRIAMIAQFRQETCRWSPLALVFLGLLAGTGLTDGLPARRVPVFEPAQVVPTTHQDRHANIVRITIQLGYANKYLAVRGNRVVCREGMPDAAALWEVRFDDDLGSPAHIVYFYSVAARRYLTFDREGNLAVNGLEPDETARWAALSYAEDTCWIRPYQGSDAYLYPTDQGVVVGKCIGVEPNQWFIHQLWRVKTSDDPRSNPEWRRRYVPGPD